MSPSAMGRAVGVARPPAVGLLAVALTALLLPLAGCGSSDDLRSLTTSDGVNLPPGVIEPAAPPEAGWPPGIATVLLSTGFKLYAVDQSGVKWSEEMQTKREASAPIPFSGLAVSSDLRWVAYVQHRKNIVVRSLLDGAVLSRTPYAAEGETYLSSLSSDGRFAALTSMQAPPTGAPANQAFWRGTAVDLQTGEFAIQHPLEDLAKERTAKDPDAQFLLYRADWLLGHRLLVNYAGANWETCLYDPATDSLDSLSDLGWVYAVSEGGSVYAITPATAAEPPQAKIWNGRDVQPLTLEARPGYPSGGTFNVRGDALVTLVSGSNGEPLGWQLFRASYGRWQAAGPLAENTWMREFPCALSWDGTVAWSSLDRTNGDVVLLSHDFNTGTWREWLAPDSLPVHLDRYHIDAIAPVGE